MNTERDIHEAPLPLQNLIWGLICKGSHADAYAIQQTHREITSLPVTYNCRPEEA